jgi:ABC-type branched-subunit amino acid transport system ATPase component
MLTKIRIQNFKQFADVEIELGQTVVFVGPNNSGKTTALQALSLWWAGLRDWIDIRQEFPDSDLLRSTSVINRLSLTENPVPKISLLWRNLEIHSANSHLEIIVSGVDASLTWSQGVKFHFANEESLQTSLTNRSPLLDIALLKVVFLPPISGLAAIEDRLERGSINRRIGEGRTAEVLRNLCYRLIEGNGTNGYWSKIVEQIKQAFSVELLTPVYDAANGSIRMEYRDRNGITLDLSSSGRGMLQVMLLLAYMYNNPGAVLLLDEPDAHLEILRQRAIYNLLTEVGSETNSQIIIATHSEALLQEAVERDAEIVAFIGKPHKMRNKDKVLNALRDVPYSEYILAQQKGWILYLEGSTDLDILRAFAQKLAHPAVEALKLLLWVSVNNIPAAAERHFTDRREAKADLVGLALFDGDIKQSQLGGSSGLTKTKWARNEIENYLVIPEALYGFAKKQYGEHGLAIMQRQVASRVPPIALNDSTDRFWITTKMSDDFLAPLFAGFFRELGQPVEVNKGDYFRLVEFIPRDKIDPEVTQKLDAIVEVARQAKPYED